MLEESIMANFTIATQRPIKWMMNNLEPVASFSWQ